MMSGARSTTSRCSLQQSCIPLPIRASLRSQAPRNLAGSDKINIDVRNNLVILTGSVGSTEQHLEAQRLSWNIAGVLSVVNDLIVELNATPGIRNPDKSYKSFSIINSIR